MVEISITSSLDGEKQKSLMFDAGGDEARPLLVGLHTWSSSYNSTGSGLKYASWCITNNWHFVHPHFRGPNNSPKAMGSTFAIQDVIDAVEHMKKTVKVDADRIYLIGVSGGGHMAMQMAAHHPEVWAGVSAWPSILPRPRHVSTRQTDA